jgi:hypothetical protein
MSIEVVKKLRGARYKYISSKFGSTDRYTLGVMAQDIKDIYPIEKYSILNKDKDNYLMVDYVQLIAPMIKAIQELTNEVEKLKNEQDKQNN